MDNKSFEEKELHILRSAVDDANILVGKKMAQSDEVLNIINILENFLRVNKTICYGGTAVNNILPDQYKFYNRNIEIPDYDFFSPYPIEAAKKLTNIYYKEGFQEVEAKSGVHKGTYKVFVNFMPIADITYMEHKLFNNLDKQSIKVNGIKYCPPNFLRMGMYQELSRPMGDVSRWEKVLKRLILLNKTYPLKGELCNKQDFQRVYEGSLEERDKIYNITKTCFINQGVIFFGGYAASLYGKYMPDKEKKIIYSIPDFDILALDPLQCVNILKEQLNYEGFNNIKIYKKQVIGDYVDIHYEIIVNKDTIAIIYKADACHSYNQIYIGAQKIKIASIDTMLYFYLIFIYANRPYFDVNRLLCMSEYLFKVQLKNRLQQKGLLRRFTTNCYGKQTTLEDIRSYKSKKFKELQDKGVNKESFEYQKHFLRYVPHEEISNRNNRNNTKNNTNNTKNNRNSTKNNTNNTKNNRNNRNSTKNNRNSKRK